MKDVRYRIINSTIKPPRPCPRTGRDLRSIRESVGNPVHVVDREGKVHILQSQPPRREMLVAELPDGILRLRDEGQVSIEAVDGVADVLKKHAAEPTKQAKPVAPATKNDMPKIDMENTMVDVSGKQQKQDPVPSQRAKAVEMGSAQKTSDITDTGAVNPDGEPNFAVTAKHKGMFSKSDGE